MASSLGHQPLHVWPAESKVVGYAFAAQYPVPRFVLIDASLPGVGPWEEILKNPLLWHMLPI